MVRQSRRAARIWGGARGWNADQFGRHRLPLLVRLGVSSGAWGMERGGGRGYRFVGTLLGPERAGIPGFPGGGRFVSCQGRSASRTTICPAGRVGSAGSGDRCLVVR